MNISQINEKIFAELGKEKQLREYRDIIYKLTGVVIDFINSEGESLKLSQMCNFNPYCKLFRNSQKGGNDCRRCDQEHARSASLSHQSLIYNCYAGLTDLVVPLFDNNNGYIGCLTTGQFKCASDNGNTPSFKDLAVRYDFDAEELRKLYSQSIVLSDDQLEGLIAYLNLIGKIIVKTHTDLIFWETIDAPDRIAMIKKYIHSHYHESLNVALLAKKFYLSTGYFSRFFHKEVGVSFMTYLNIYRVSKAKELLSSTRRGIAEIAFLTGFGSVSQFNRLFKSTEGMPPKELRRNSL